MDVAMEIFTWFTIEETDIKKRAKNLEKQKWIIKKAIA
jgi:hypothetical protein